MVKNSTYYRGGQGTEYWILLRKFPLAVGGLYERLIPQLFKIPHH